MTRRILILALLLLINGILFGAIWGLPWLPQQPGAREPERMARQQHREAIEIMRANTSNAPDTPKAPDASEAPSAAVSQDTATDQQCMELGSWTAAQLRAAEDDLAKLRSSYPAAQITQVERRDTEQLRERLWVRLPSFRSRSDAEQAVADLGRRQIDDVSIVTDSAQGTFTVSLGVFRDPVRAERHLEGLKKKGVQRAIITPDPRAPSRIWLQVSHQADAAMEAQLEGLRKRYRLNALAECAN